MDNEKSNERDHADEETDEEFAERLLAQSRLIRGLMPLLPQPHDENDK